MSRIREAAERFIGVLKPTISQQASQEESWNAAHKRMEEALGVDLMVHLATGIRLQGDSTASVWESTRKHYIQGYMLTLRWDTHRSNDYARGVRIVATPQGETVEYTVTSLGQWRSLDHVRDARTQRFFSRDRSLEERVRFAMKQSTPISHYYYGEAERRWEGKGVIERRIF